MKFTFGVPNIYYLYNMFNAYIITKNMTTFINFVFLSIVFLIVTNVQCKHIKFTSKITILSIVPTYSYTEKCTKTPIIY